MERFPLFSVVRLFFAYTLGYVYCCTKKSILIYPGFPKELPGVHRHVGGSMQHHE